MKHRVALATLLIAAPVAVGVALSTPAYGAGITTTTITSPTDGAHYLVTDVNPATNVTVTGTSVGGSVGDLLDLRCYTNPGQYESYDDMIGVPIDASGNFSVEMSTDVPYGTCALRAVPHDYPAASSIASFHGPKVTTDVDVTRKIASGPHAGLVYDYYVAYTTNSTMNDYRSASSGALGSVRLQHSDGTSGNQLWSGAGGLPRVFSDSRSSVQVDGRNAYGPDAAALLFPGSNALPGLVGLTYDSERDPVDGTVTVTESEPFVACSTETYPPTAGTCAQFSATGVRLDRTLTTFDDGRQTDITDVWRSIDGKPHTLSLHYRQAVDGFDDSSGTPTASLVGVKQPWHSPAFETYLADTVTPGPDHGPASVFLRDDMAADDGNLDYPRGAVTFDVTPDAVHRTSHSVFTLQDEDFRVPASGSRTVRHSYVIGATQAEVDAKAAASEKRLNPYRVDGAIKTKRSPYRGEDVYGNFARHEKSTARVARGVKATFSVRIENDGSVVDGIRLRAPGSNADVSVRYLSGKKDVTKKVSHRGYVLSDLAPGARRVIRMVVMVRNGARIGRVRTWLINATSTTDGSRRDAVKAAVHVVNG